MAGSDTVQSVERALDLLQALATADGGLRLSELAERLDLNTTTAHNLVRTLIGRGFVVKGQAQRLGLGPAIAELLAQDQDRRLLAAAATSGLELQRAFPDGIVNVAEVSGGDLLVRVRLSADRPGLVQRPPHQTAHLYGSAVGLCTLACADQGTVQALRESHPFHESAPGLWPSPEALDEHLAAAAKAGHVATPFPRQELWRVAAPVTGPDGLFRAAIGLALPAAQADAARRRQAIAAVTAAAAAIALPT